MQSKRLGRGLEALIPQTSEGEAAPPIESLSDIPVNDIQANPLQPRLKFDRDHLEELKNSIAENGIIQPITIRRKGSGYELIAGERRLRAVQELGYDRIPAYVMEVESDDRMLELALIENIQREDLNPLETARAYEQLQKEYGLTQEDVARKVSKDRATVANFIRLLKLPEQIQDSLRKEEINMGQAKAIMGLGTRSAQIKMWQKCLKASWSVRKIEEEVRKYSESGSMQKKNSTKERSPHLAELEDTLRSVLGTRVRVIHSTRGGRIEISYFSEEELERITELITATQE